MPVAAAGLAVGLDFGKKRLEALAIQHANGVRFHIEMSAALGFLKLRRGHGRKFHFLGVHDVEQHHVETGTAE